MRISNTILLGAMGLAAACDTESAPSATADDVVFCQTPEHLQAMLSAPRTKRIFKADGPRQLRDDFGTFSNVKTSEHFALKWGDKVTLDESKTQAVLEALERAWQKEIVEMKHPAPLSTEAYFYNAYIGNSGENSPEIPFTGGYSTIDNAGLPYFVLHPGTMAWNANDVGALIAHEFYHSIQYATGGFGDYTETTAWYWEASAVWIAEEIYPKSIASQQMGSYALLPNLPVDYYEPSAKLQAGHHYAAAIFLRFLTEAATDENFIHDTWIGAESYTDPLERVTDLLKARGQSLDEVFAQFAAHTSVWDYKNAQEYANGMLFYLKRYPKEDHRFAGELDLATVGEKETLVAAKADTTPEAYAYNVIQLKASKGAVRLVVLGDALGDSGTPSRLRATVVRKYDDHVSYTPLTFDGVRGTVELSDFGSEKESYLVVASVPGERRFDEHFGFQYGAVRLSTMSSDTPPLDTSPATEASGCSIGRPTSVRSVSFLVMALLIASGALAQRRSIAGVRRKGARVRKSTLAD